MRRTKEFRQDERYAGMEDKVRNRWRNRSKKSITSPTGRVERFDEETEEPLTEFDM